MSTDVLATRAWLSSPSAGYRHARGLVERHWRTRARRHVWTLIWAGIGAGAVYVLLPQAAALQESLASLSGVQPAWVAVAAALVAVRYVLAALSLRAAVGVPLPFGPTLLVQVSSAFIGRFTPEGLGWLVLNQRYLEKSGLSRTSAAAAITLKVLAGVVVRVTIMAAVASLVGTSSVDLGGVPLYVVAGLLGVVAITLLLASAFPLPASRVMAPIQAGARDLARVLRQPLRGLALLGTSAGLPISYALVLAVSARAFGVEASPLNLVAVHLGATAVAAASPTPGNLGAVELALTGGLVAVGVPTGAAVAAVLVYRLLTFWLPLIPGFLALRYLQAKHRI